MTGLELLLLHVTTGMISLGTVVMAGLLWQELLWFVHSQGMSPEGILCNAGFLI